MKTTIKLLCLLFSLTTLAQKDCVFSTNINDSIGTYQETKNYLMNEKIFGGKSTYLFFSLIKDNGTPKLKVQKIEKSANFIAANCLDKQSKIYLQLLNGKIITLLYGDNDTCGNLIRVDNDPVSSRVTTGNFLFLKGSIEDLKTSPIWEIRIRYATETVNFIINKELKSELMNESFFPESYFIDHLHCVLD